VTDSPQNERREVLFSGRVQGVGFRFTAREIAGRFAVSGYVKNLYDGRVQLVAEGEARELERFVQAVTGEMQRFISSVDSTSSAATGEFVDFSVRL
jgi:acylphosphatase